MIWVVSLSQQDVITLLLTACQHLPAFGVCLGLVPGEGP